MGAPAGRRLLLATASLGAGFAAALGMAELGLRALGFEPARFIGGLPNEPVMHQPDPRLGWRKLPGRFMIPPYAPGQAPVVVTTRRDGTRAAGTQDAAGPEQVVFVGGSFTFGAAISDPETFAWKIQSRHPDVRIANRAAVGYGTYQSLLVLEELFARDGPPPQRVLYGFIEHHEDRNVAQAAWQKSLGVGFLRHIPVPYCTIGPDGALVRQPPQAYPDWPGSGRLALVNLLQDRWATWRARAREAQKAGVTERLLLEMDALCRAHGARFAVVLLRLPDDLERRYRKLLDAHGVPIIDCRLPLTPELKVRGEGHPNGLMNSRWARCIDAGIGVLP